MSPREPAGSSLRLPGMRRIALLALMLLLTGCGSELPVVTPNKPATATAAAPCAPAATATASAAAIHLDPASGGPGTVVCITGFLPGGPVEAHASMAEKNGTVCWDGCRRGLTESVPVAWSADHPGLFAAHLTVPRTAWLTAGGPKPLASGTYQIGVQCLVPSRGCRLRPAEAAAPFRLAGAAPTRCVAGKPCATLKISSDVGRPGGSVHVTGWAPLTQIIGRPFGYYLELEQDGRRLAGVGQVRQARDGRLTGSATIPAGGAPLQPGRYTIVLEYDFLGVPTAQPIAKRAHVVGGRIELAPTPLTVVAAPTWASLGALRPLAIQPSAVLFGDSITATPGGIAYCIPGGIRVSRDGGRRWSTVPDTGIAGAAAKIGHAIPGFSRKVTRATCVRATADPTHPGSLYATFQMVTAKCDCMPPAFVVGFATADGGRTWAAVPQPAAIAPVDGDLGFGGFQVQGDGVAALFGRREHTLAVELTADGGRTWTAGQLACPATGACVRWGAAPSSISACMTDFPQPVEASADGGKSWASATSADLCSGTSQLVSFRGGRIAVLSDGASHGVGLSQDGGRTWEYVALPPLAGRSTYHGLTMLPDGALLASATAWDVLPPGAAAWCPVPALTAPTGGTRPVAADGRLWWLTGVNQQRTPALHSVPLNRLTCAG